MLVTTVLPIVNVFSPFGGLPFVVIVAIVLASRKSKPSSQKARFKRYRAAMGDEKMVPISRLAEAVQSSEAFVRKDLAKMIRQGLIQEGYIDNEEDLFFLDAEVYRAFQQQQEAAFRQAAAKQAQPQSAVPKTEMDELQQQGDDFLLLLNEHVRATGNEPEVCAQLKKMHATSQSILSWVKAHPSSIGKVKKFSRYYMPTTLKLLRSYDDVKDQESKVAEGIRSDIGGILSTLNVAFDNLLADLLSDTALDISSEISAMQTMLAQDGLTLEEFTMKE